MRQPTRRTAFALGLAALVVAGTVAPAVAQGWTWPWETPKRQAPPPLPPPVPSAPVYRQPGAGEPPPGYGAPGANAGRPPICYQLEQRLAREVNRGTNARDQLPVLEGQIRQAARQEQVVSAQLDQSDCYDYFLFSKTLRRSRTCLDLANQQDQARRTLADLQTQRQNIISSNGASFRDDIIAELARNNCGATYAQEARRSSGGIWQDEGGGGPATGKFDQLPFATYRTMCVRLCDGFYFPISFSTLPNHFDQDADSCKNECAAPTELYYYQNPGGAVEQMQSYGTRQPYTSLKSAYRFRKEFVQGCSCKQAEYVPSTSPDATVRRTDAASPVGVPPAAVGGPGAGTRSSSIAPVAPSVAPVLPLPSAASPTAAPPPRSAPLTPSSDAFSARH